MNEGDLRSKPLARSGDRREQIILSSFMVPYGQASHSPDHERWLTFRSQKTDDLIIIIVDQSQENRRPAVNFLARSGDRGEQRMLTDVGTRKLCEDCFDKIPLQCCLCHRMFNRKQTSFWIAKNGMCCDECYEKTLQKREKMTG